MSVITENNKDHLLNYEGVEQLLVKINDRFARTDRYATPDTLGMIRAEINTEVNSEDISTGDNHPVQITTDGNAFVNINVPTTDDFADDFAAVDHTHHEINNDFIVTSATANGTNEASISVISENGVNINATGDDYIYNTSLKVKDTGVDVYIDDSEMMEYTSIAADSNSVSVNSSNIHLTTYDGWEDNHINITDTIDIGCYVSDMDYTQEDVIRIDGGVEITSFNDDGSIQNQSSIVNTSNEIQISSNENYNDGIEDRYTISANILLHKNDIDESEIVITARKESTVEDEDGYYNHINTSGTITINASDTQSNIELLADNISIKSNSNSASNKVFTTNGGIATLPTIPSSLPANGGNADTVDGKHASDFAVANHNHTISVTSTFIPNVTSSYNNGVLTILGATTNVQCTGTTDVENTNANPESWFVNPDDMTALF